MEPCCFNIESSLSSAMFHLLCCKSGEVPRLSGEFSLERFLVCSVNKLLAVRFSRTITKYTVVCLTNRQTRLKHEIHTAPACLRELSHAMRSAYAPFRDDSRSQRENNRQPSRFWHSACEMIASLNQTVRTWNYANAEWHEGQKWETATESKFFPSTFLLCIALPEVLCIQKLLRGLQARWCT